MATNQPLIRASEIGLYAYCARAWWLQRVRGIKSENISALRVGVQRHAQHGRRVALAYELRLLGYGLLTLAFVLIVWGIGRYV
ncbi:MAG: hypothetical protein RML36_14135 [Anaerolineae bacterium]|nr:hypothetical protein [Anaerolineae bacterium]MDW8100615.1 hypothetical protein [Anaerolineae bacterium]